MTIRLVHDEEKALARLALEQSWQLTKTFPEQKPNPRMCTQKTSLMRHTDFSLSINLPVYVNCDHQVYLDEICFVTSLTFYPSFSLLTLVSLSY